MRTVLSVLVVSFVVSGGLALAQGVNICDYTPPRNELFAISLSGDYRYFDDSYLDDRGNVSVGHLAVQGVSWLAEPEWGYRLEGTVRLTASASYNRMLSPTAALTALYSFSGRQSPTGMTQLHAITVTLNLRVSTALSTLARVETSWGTGFEEPSWGLSLGFQYTLY
jgi:hypothetical protein